MSGATNIDEAEVPNIDIDAFFKEYGSQLKPGFEDLIRDGTVPADHVQSVLHMMREYIEDQKKTVLVGSAPVVGMQVPLEPGRYWFGDPYYLFRGDWRQFWHNSVCHGLHSERPDFGAHGIFMRLKFGCLLIARTAFGDGAYRLSPNAAFHNLSPGPFPVDAGLLAVIPEAFALQSPAHAEVDQQYGKFTIEQTTLIRAKCGDWYIGDDKVCDTGGDQETNSEGIAKAAASFMGHTTLPYSLYGNKV